MKLVIPGRLPCMNDLIAANRLNKYAGAGVKKKTQRQISLILQPQFILDALQDMDLIPNDSRKYVHLTQEVFTDRKNPRIEITIKGGMNYAEREKGSRDTVPCC